uniref:Large ribosomal subunit protein uL6 alpha-beta domain-containing protein n=1 Tax=Dunaliella tertiolecta TaxID=3047 RepID=A0A7S3VK86_DUNTE|mmetsp:Transcript_2475/g.6352  ORF Transcript_2475/g.6352 Transcript_2475/m.6352 type:complete len:213 (-) Transcript_2475:515-1153(-)|eukprot:CAMPEP_0202346070 /NCGR_PEP_ID=MMETSP1126-20121109/5021_1 /ASSEMBLY_ACC=CAM_ASM_000457 /TAXON_ID=3047 /ORGANISM="Dunaliella tertiolecta, Strain CCMP1320" /LENGTH=212 /DNA_ID=CAMNT_0048937431 /DNA_START=29 /DNA_END=667 /DNA_ORIENTATION=+
MLAQQRAFSSAASSSAPRQSFSRVQLNVVARESRIGGKPIPVPKGTTITVDGLTVKAKGPNGALEHTMTPYVKLEQTTEMLRMYRGEETKLANAQHGLQRTLLANMVTGVSTGFTKKLQLFGTGYRASATNKELTLNVGYSNPRVLEIPEGLKVTVEKNTTITITGADKAKIGDFASTVRRQREPEPYKGKGIRYEGEVIKLKEGKAGGKKK